VAGAHWRGRGGRIRCPRHGVTLSTEQLEFATERLRRHGLAARSDLRLQDYRDITDEPFDAIASIEMFEAVGREYWDSFFATLRGRLKPGGRACIQTITIRDDLFERYTRSTDFIQQYIFPGGLLPSPQAFRSEARRAGLEVVNELAFGADYAETLRRWRVAFLARDPQCASSASTPASCASGSSTWRIAKRPSTPAIPTSCSSPLRRPA